MPSATSPAPEPNSQPPSHRPPGPWGYLPWTFVSQPTLEFITGLTRRYGETVQFTIGPVKYYVLSHPHDVVHVLRDRGDIYNKQTHDYWLLRRIMGYSLLTGDGDFWRQRRRLIQPAFQRDQLAHLAQATHAATETMLQSWEAAAKTGTPINLHREMTQLTLRIIGQTLFSVDLLGEAREFGKAIHLMNGTSDWGPRFLLSQIPGLNYRYMRAANYLDSVIQSLIDQRRKSSEAIPDLLTALVHARDPETGMALSDREVRNEIMTLLLAGHDTSATHLSWTFWLLTQHATEADIVRQEVDQVLHQQPPAISDLAKLPKLRAMLDESMRLYPPIWAIPRYAMQADTLPKYEVSRGTYILVVPYLVHRHPEFWPDPEAFRPSRFDREVSPAPTVGSYIPFGFGPRTCVGAAFATTEAQLIVASLLQRFRWELLPNQKVRPVGFITLQPAQDIWLRVHLR